ncbi:hypothetical protein BDN72DRAFT_865099 [Pluteus cervinus]|uniref:Uncharacterized protein n=1 Tax=Pluteus cervinus TaxID=181527 RepID=A0ACD3A1I6_9AGAR|nr:hypothetical protein BDN72DRAFT_865099 [Pluteus cervinus]
MSPVVRNMELGTVWQNMPTPSRVLLCPNTDTERSKFKPALATATPLQATFSLARLCVARVESHRHDFESLLLDFHPRELFAQLEIKLGHIGPAELKSNPNLLIHARNPSLQDDPTLWPQRYMQQACHLAAIPRRPDDRDDPFQLFWKDFEEADFIPIDDTLLSGLGHPSQDLISNLKTYVDKLDSAIAQYKEIKKENAANQVFFLRRAFSDSKTRFLSLALTYEQLRFAWTDVQRLFLEVQAALDYAVKFRPRMTGEIWHDPTLPPARTVGTITSNPAVVQQMYSAGLPVWFLRTYGAVAAARVDAVTDASQPSDFLFMTHADPPAPIIYTGHPNDYQIYVAMKFYH